MLLSEVQSILAALLTLVLGVYNALPIGDFHTDAPARQRVEQSTTEAPSPVQASYPHLGIQPGPDTGPDDKKPSVALSEFPPTDSTRTIARSVADSPSVNVRYSAGHATRALIGEAYGCVFDIADNLYICDGASSTSFRDMFVV